MLSLANVAKSKKLELYRTSSGKTCRKVILVLVSAMLSGHVADEFEGSSRVQTDVQKKKFHSPKGQRL
jgi:hypothetical protein